MAAVLGGTAAFVLAFDNPLPEKAEEVLVLGIVRVVFLIGWFCSMHLGFMKGKQIDNGIEPDLSKKHMLVSVLITVAAVIVLVALDQ